MLLFLSKSAAAAKASKRKGPKEDGAGAGGSGAPLGEAALSALVGSQSDARNVFVELRKAANHPLLLREHFRDEAKMSLVAKRLYGHGHFGDTCTMEMVGFGGGFGDGEVQGSGGILALEWSVWTSHACTWVIHLPNSLYLLDNFCTCEKMIHVLSGSESTITDHLPLQKKREQMKPKASLKVQTCVPLSLFSHR